MATIKEQLKGYRVNLDKLAETTGVKRELLKPLENEVSIETIGKIDEKDGLTKIDLKVSTIGLNEKDLAEAKIKDTFQLDAQGNLPIQTLESKGIITPNSSNGTTQTAVTTNVETFAIDPSKPPSIDELNDPKKFDAWMRLAVPKKGDMVFNQRNNQEEQRKINTGLIDKIMRVARDAKRNDLMKKICFACLSNDLTPSDDVKSKDIKVAAAVLTAVFMQQEQGYVSLGEKGEITSSVVNDLASNLEIVPDGYNQFPNQFGSGWGGDWLNLLIKSPNGKTSLEFTQSGIANIEQGHIAGMIGSGFMTGLGAWAAVNCWNPTGWGAGLLLALGGITAGMGATNFCDWMFNKSKSWESFRNDFVIKQCMNWLQGDSASSTPSTFNVNKNNQNTIVTPTSSPTPLATPVGSPPQNSQTTGEGRSNW